MRQHFLDSLSCLRADLFQPGKRVLDIGSGAGFPGIPLKIYQPELQLVAVDAVTKKVMFLRHLCRALELPDVACVAARLPSDASASAPLPPALPRHSFDVIVSRAVGEIAYLLSLAAPFLKPGGHLIFQRGYHAPTEFDAAQQISPAYGLCECDLLEIKFSFLTHPRYLMVLQHVAKRS